MTRRWFRTAVAAATVLVLIPLSLSAQRVSRRVYLTAIDTGGLPVLDLTKAEVQVTEDGQKREVTRVALGDEPMRIVLLVDSSAAVAPMINSFKAALNTFVDTLPAEHEIAFISTGGQIRVRTKPEDDREKLRAEMARFAADGGANSFLETLIEADRRFLKTAPNQWPAFVILTTDSGDTRREPRIDDYNKFMQDFVARGGIAHAVIVVGRQVGPVTDLVQNLIENVGGIGVSINTDNVLPARVREIAERIATDHDRMMNRYEVEFTGDAKLQQPLVKVEVSRDGVQVGMSPRRPF